MNLIIVESPAKCSKIESFLDKSYKCEASFGHFRHLESLNDIDEHFNINFKTIKEKYKQIQKLQSLIDKSSSVILATDNDREGEAIAWHIIDYFKLPINTKRILFNEITKDAFLYSLNHPTTVNMNIVQSQQTRQILDLFVGFKISPTLWKNISYKSNLSAGRCQTPALNLIYENYNLHKNSSPSKIYNLFGYFTSKNIQFQLNKTIQDEKNIIHILNLCISKIFQLSIQPITQKHKSPPKPLVTSTIQQKCSNSFNMSPKETMNICQKLYESGVITYMRTDSHYLSDEFISSANKYINDTYTSKYYNDKYIQPTKQAHEAIRPTNIYRKSISSDFSPKEQKMYNLIWKQTLQSLMKEAIINEQQFILPLDYEDYHFYHTSETIVFDGWTILDKKSNADFSNYLTSINTNNIVYSKIFSKGSMTNTVSHYSEASLVKKLESLGIGRPSTFSSLIEKIKERKYVDKKNIQGYCLQLNNYEIVDNKINKIKSEIIYGNENNKLVITSLGIMVIENLIHNFQSLFEYSFTESMENKCDQIANGTLDKLSTSLNYKNMIEELISNVQNKDKYMIDEQHEFIIGKNGPVLKTTQDGKTIFKNIIIDVDFDKIKNKEYTLDQLLLENNDINLGTYSEQDIIIKTGKFGPYFIFDNKNISLNKINKPIDKITIIDCINLLTESKNNILKEFSNNLSIRNGNYGHFIFYKTDKMKKPSFISLKNFNGDYLTCDESLIEEYIQQEINKPKKPTFFKNKFKK